MALSLWECDVPDCPRKVVGAGGAIGLRAIGWYFLPGTVAGLTDSVLRCPGHRPDAVSAKADDLHEADRDCSYCAANVEASRLQTILYAVLPEFNDGSHLPLPPKHERM